MHSLEHERLGHDANRCAEAHSQPEIPILALSLTGLKPANPLQDVAAHHGS
jgi:hypothetical protein